MNILLVDDEPFVLRTLSEVVENAKESWHVVAEAQDGEQAIEILNKQDVDLVVTDIRMPAVDGIRLLQYTKSRFPWIKIILLTGYSEFEYAREAIRAGAEDYILKPSSVESIVQCLERMERKLINEQDLGRLRKKRELSILEKRLDDALFGIPVPHYDQSLIPGSSRIYIFSCHVEERMLTDGWSLSTAFAAFKNVAEESMSSCGKVFTLIQEQHFAVILFCHPHLDFTPKPEWIALFQKQIHQLMKIEVRIGVGRCSIKLEELHVRYRESLRALNHAKTVNLPISCVRESEDVGDRLPEPLEQKFQSKKNHRVVSLVVEMLEQRLHEELTLTSLAEEVYLNPAYLGRIFKEETRESFSNYLIKLRMERAKDLLADPTVKVYEVCGQVGYQDPAHFSHLFKKWVGETPQQYKLRH